MTDNKNQIDKDSIDKNPIGQDTCYISRELDTFPISTNLNITQRLSNAQKELIVLVKDKKTYFGKGYTLDAVFSYLHPAFTKHGIFLKYRIILDDAIPKNPIIYFPSKDKEDSWGIRKIPKTIVTTTTNKDVIDKVFTDVNQVVHREEINTYEAVGKTVLFYKFSGEWVNKDDTLDTIAFEFPILVELKDGLDASQSLGAASTYAFRTNLCKQFQITSVEEDVDFMTVTDEVREGLKAKITDNDLSSKYKIIKLNDPTDPFIIQKENEFQTKLKKIYGDCNSYYDFLLHKYVIHTARDLKLRSSIRTEITTAYDKLIKE